MSNNDASQALKTILGGGIVAFHSVFARAINVNCGLMLSQGLFWQENAKYRDVFTFQEHGEKPFFQKTAAEWHEETGLSTEQQATAREMLVRLGILIEKKAGLPAKLYFHIDMEVLVSVINQYKVTGLPVSVKAKNKFPENPETKVPENPETVIGENPKQYIGIESIESFDSILEREESAFHAQLKDKNAFEQNGASPAATGPKPQPKTTPKAERKTPLKTQTNTDQSAAQNTPQNTSPAAKLKNAISESMDWITENTDIVKDWFMLSKQTPPANNADIPAYLQDQIVSFFSYYQQNGNPRAINNPVDFLQTSFIRWMMGNREKVAAQAQNADRTQTGSTRLKTAASAAQTDAPLAHIPWVK